MIKFKPNLKNKYLIICLFIVIIAGIILLILPQTSPFTKEPLYIAVAGPMTGAQKPDGDEMVWAVQMYLDKVNKKGGIDGRKIKLIAFDDKNQPKISMNIAAEIADHKKVLLVLGHNYNSTSIAAGRIYKKNGIPALTGSATSEMLTQGNEWYFSIIPNNNFEGSFIANYVLRAINKKAASIIFNKDDYGVSLSESFERTARDIGLEIKKKWDFDSEKEDADIQLRKITAELRTMEDPGVIFVAAYEEVGAKIISALKYPGSKYTFIGPDSFSSASIIRELNKLPQEQAIPGYYSDNIFAISPFLSDIANEKAYTFRQEYIKRYNVEPSWGGAYYYDAAMIAVEALKKSDIHADIRKSRREVRDALANISNREEAIRGVTGLIYFDKNRNVKQPLPVGIYKNQKLIPAFAQYQMLPEPIDKDISLEDMLKSNTIAVDGTFMGKTHIVYTGIDINEISNLDIKKCTYTMDFYLWFRYEGNIDASNIVFVNSVDKVKLEAPISTEKIDNYTIQSYHVKADFKGDFDFHLYPFDSQQLYIKYRHNTQTKDKLIYVVDTMGIPPPVSKKEIGKIDLRAVSGWYIKELSFYQDNITEFLAPEETKYFDSQNFRNYSQFNASTLIKRTGFDQVLRNYLPIFIMIVVLYLIYYIPCEQYVIRVLSISLILLSNVFYHVKHILDLPVKYFTIIAYAIHILYALILLAVLLSTTLFFLSRRFDYQKIQRITRVGTIAHPCLFLGAILWIIFIHFYLTLTF